MGCSATDCLIYFKPLCIAVQGGYFFIFLMISTKITKTTAKAIK